MNRLQIEALLKEVSEGRASVDDALGRLRDLPFEDLGFAKLDHHRSLRTGMPEVIFAAGKTTAQVATIFTHMAQAGGNVLATRASQDAFNAVSTAVPRAVYHEAARAIALAQAPVPPARGPSLSSAPAPAIFPLLKRRPSPHASPATRLSSSPTSASPASIVCLRRSSPCKPRAC